MPSDTTDTPATTDSWNTYWQGTLEAPAFSGGGVNHPAISAFWSEFLAGASQHSTPTRLLDIGSGNGAMVEYAISAFGNRLPDITCVDLSPAAIAALQQRYPAAHCIVADAANIPFEAGRFDLVVSQFGVEYAGIHAVHEAMRMLASGGQMALLLHHREGRIYKSFMDNIEALKHMHSARFIPAARRVFEAGFRAVRGADRADYETAGAEFAPAIRAVEKIFEDYGQNIAGDMVIRLYDDVARIHSNMQGYDPVEVDNWLVRMQDEIDAYAGRMASMCDCAIDVAAFNQVRDELRELGLDTSLAGPLSVKDDALPLAWLLVATRRSIDRTSDADRKDDQSELDDWARQQLDLAVADISSKGLLAGELLEARPVWAHGHSVLIAQVREQGEKSFTWLICGDVPTDQLGSEAAATPREAARHFAMKWHLEAARDEDDALPATTALTDKAEALFALINNDSLWS